MAVLLNMRFNLGLGGLMRFKNFLRHVQQGSWSKARLHMLESRWASQVGRRAVELAAQMESGLWQREPKVSAKS